MDDKITQTVQIRTPEQKASSRLYFITHKEHINAMRRANRLKNPEKIRAQERIQSKRRNRDTVNARGRKLYYAHHDKELARGKMKRLRDKEKIVAWHKEHYQKNRERLLEQGKIYLSNNREKRRAYIRSYRFKNYRLNPEYRLEVLLRARLKAAVNGHAYKKAESAMKLIGCSVPELKMYLEGQFKDGMTWENHGLHGWHIDHKIPLSFFSLEDVEQQKQAFHYSNLQPLWALDNLRKHAKILV